MPNLTETFTQIADAIRSKTGTTDKIAYYNFPTAIENITAVKTGTVKFTSKTTTLTINTGLTSITNFTLQCVSTPSETWALDGMYWSASTGLGASGLYRGTWTAGYGQDGWTVSVSGGTITLTTSVANLGLAPNTTYRWMAI